MPHRALALLLAAVPLANAATYTEHTGYCIPDDSTTVSNLKGKHDNPTRL